MKKSIIFYIGHASLWFGVAFAAHYFFREITLKPSGAPLALIVSGIILLVIYKLQECD